MPYAQPISESPIQVSTGMEAHAGLPYYHKLLLAERDPARLAYQAKAKKYAEEKLGLTPRAADFYAKNAASVYNWAMAPWRNGKPNPYCVRNAMVQNSLLREDDWRQLQDVVLDVARKRLNGVSDLTSRGLVYPLRDIGVYQVEWDRFSDLDPAIASMHMRGNKADDRGQFDRVAKPVPIVHKTFQFDIRDLLASRSGGAALDLTHAAVGTKLVAEKAESLLFSGDSTIVFQSNTLTGYDSTTLTETTAKDFGTVANIEEKFRLVITALRAQNHYGPFVVYLHPTQYGEMKQPRSATSDITMLNFVLDQHPEIEAIKESQYVTAGSGYVVEMDAMSVDIAIAQDITTVQWDDPDGTAVNIRVMWSGTPRIKNDASSQTGVLKMTGI